ncbi:MAG: class I SAM-dependent methyltransferase [Candidatus Poribacteria bacterium]|nr:class I SAM-dependent methyltransferase [Candidatus Poribacteria bacterium]
MEEYNKVNSIFYDYYATGLKGDIQFYVEEVQKTGGPVLDLGCGTGRILIPVAESGITIVGLDRSQAMLTMLEKKVTQLNIETQRRIELVKGDMHNFSLERSFKLIMIPYRSFMHLLSVEKQRQALCCIRAHLTEGGCLVFNLFDPQEGYIPTDIDSGSFGPALRKESEFISPYTGHSVIVWGTYKHDPELQMIVVRNLFEELSDSGRVVSRTYSNPFSLRYFYRYEMEYLLQLCGYRVKTLYGSFQREPFKPGSEQIWVAQRN